MTKLHSTYIIFSENGGNRFKAKKCFWFQIFSYDFSKISLSSSMTL